MREQAREETKMQKWFDNWSPQQMRFHKELVRKIVQESQEKTEVILDSCYIGAMIEHSEIDISKCIEIAKLANTNMEQTSQYLKKEKGYYNMINDENLRTKIREEAKKLQKEGIKIAPGIKELRKTYDFPQKDIHIIWAEGKEELKVEEKINEEIPYVVTEKEIEASREVMITIEEDATLEPSKLKIINRTIEVQGEYGHYIKASDGVRTEQKLFKGIIELNEYKANAQAEISRQEQNLKEQIEELKSKYNKLQEEKDRTFNSINEIELVFNM